MNSTSTPGIAAFSLLRALRLGLLVLAALLATGTAYADGRLRHATDLRATAIDDSGAAEVVVSFNSPPTFSARLTRGGKRLLIDVPNSKLRRGVPTAITRPAGVVAGVMAQGFKKGDQRTVRILITLKKKSEYSLRASGNRLVVTFKKHADSVRRLSKKKQAKRDSDQLARVLDVRYEHKSVMDRVYVRLSHVPSFKSLGMHKGRARILLRDTQLPERLQRTLDVGAYNGKLTSVSSYSPKKGKSKSTVIIEADVRDEFANSLVRRGTTLIWTFFKKGSLPSTVTGVGADGGIARKSRTIHREDTYADLPKVGTNFGELGGDAAVEDSVEGGEASGFTTGGSFHQTRRRRYRGRRIDLDLKDADIHNVLRLLADVGRVNIVTADNVQGSVTIRMRNVPWDQALDVVLQAKKLGMVRQGNMIRVALSSDLQKERELEIARRKAEADLAPLETRLIPVSYATASDIQARARDLLSSRGTIAVDDRTNVLIVRDVSGNLNQIEELTRSLDTQTPQVLVEARIVEATSRYLRDVGIQWGGDATFSSATGNPTGLAFPNSVGVVGGASDGNTPTQGLSPFSQTVQNPNFAVNLPAAVGTGSGGAIGLRFGAIDNTINLAVRLSAAEQSGMLRILSSPRILTLDNRQARISQGTLIPFSQVSAQGVQTTFQEAKLQLLVTPHVTADGSVSMHVKINRDEPDFNQTSARGDPTILKREAETDLLVMDGHTAVIGGIYTRNTGRNLDQVPFFGDIPLLGLLFQRRRASDTRSELVIFLTPRIVNRAEALGR